MATDRREDTHCAVCGADLDVDPSGTFGLRCDFCADLIVVRLDDGTVRVI
jgi:hypothetical protein